MNWSQIETPISGSHFLRFGYQLKTKYEIHLDIYSLCVHLMQCNTLLLLYIQHFEMCMCFRFCRYAIALN